MDRQFYAEEIIKKVAGPYLRESFLMPTHRFFQGTNVGYIFFAITILAMMMIRLLMTED